MTSKRSFLKLAGLTAALSLGLAANADAMDVTGAGATFPQAVYSKWAEAYKAASGNTVNYQGIGSSGGIKQIKARTVDFGATDAALTESELAQDHLVQFPAVMGAAVFVANLQNVKSGELKLDGATAADIMRGAIAKWNDARIVALNPGLKLAGDITLVHRSDGSGTTNLVTNYLAKQSVAFMRDVGAGKEVKWPGNSVGGKGNAGVAASVKKIVGAIGYADYADAVKSGMDLIQLKNRDGQFVQPSVESFKAAAAGADFKHAPGLAPDLIDQHGKNAWPMVTATFILLHEKSPDLAKAKGVLDFFKWSFENGAQMAADLSFVPLPENVTKLVEAEWHHVK